MTNVLETQTFIHFFGGNVVFPGEQDELVKMVEIYGVGHQQSHRAASETLPALFRKRIDTANLPERAMSRIQCYCRY